MSMRNVSLTATGAETRMSYVWSDWQGIRSGDTRFDAYPAAGFAGGRARTGGLLAGTRRRRYVLGITNMALTARTSGPLVLQLPSPRSRMSDAEFLAFCRANPELRIEQTAAGE